MSLKLSRDLNCSLTEQKKLMRETRAANTDMQRIFAALEGTKGAQGAHQARAIAKQWLEDRGLI